MTDRTPFAPEPEGCVTLDPEAANAIIDGELTHVREHDALRSPEYAPHDRGGEYAQGLGRIPCRRCSGTGAFITYVENGQPKGPGGPCYRCSGKGWQDDADRRRNYGYDNYAPIRGM